MSADHYFTAAPDAGEATGGGVHRRRPDFRLDASGGVFSASRLDPGTAVLLRKAHLPEAGTAGALLDLGCGYGPIACVLATVAPRAHVYAVDVNARALELTRAQRRVGWAGRPAQRRARPDDVPDDRAVRPDLVQPADPGRQGGTARAAAALAAQAGRRTASAWLVVGRHLGADSLAAWLTGRVGG